MRDIFNTSRADRLTIARFVDTSMIDIEMANKMLYRVWEDNFGARKQQNISAEEAEDMGHIILAACNLISGAIRDYNFMAGAPDARVHDLRHTFAVLSLQNGDDVKTVQENLGHATAAFTLDVYGHVSERMKEDSAARMQGYFENLKKA